MGLIVARVALVVWAAVSLAAGLVEIEGFDGNGEAETGSILLAAAALIAGAVAMSTRGSARWVWLMGAAGVAFVSVIVFLTVEAA